MPCGPMPLSVQLRRWSSSRLAVAKIPQNRGTPWKFSPWKSSAGKLLVEKLAASAHVRRFVQASHLRAQAHGPNLCPDGRNPARHHHILEDEAPRTLRSRFCSWLAVATAFHPPGKFVETAAPHSARLNWHGPPRIASEGPQTKKQNRGPEDLALLKNPCCENRSLSLSLSPFCIHTPLSPLPSYPNSPCATPGDEEAAAMADADLREVYVLCIYIYIERERDR